MSDFFTHYVSSVKTEQVMTMYWVTFTHDSYNVKN